MYGITCKIPGVTKILNLSRERPDYWVLDPVLSWWETWVQGSSVTKKWIWLYASSCILCVVPRVFNGGHPALNLVHMVVQRVLISKLLWQPGVWKKGQNLCFLPWSNLLSIISMLVTTPANTETKAIRLQGRIANLCGISTYVLVTSIFIWVPYQRLSNLFYSCLLSTKPL